MSTASMNLNERALAAARRFLTRKGCEVFEDGFEACGSDKMGLVASEDDTIIFASVTVSEEGGFEPSMKRGEMEAVMASWLAQHGDNLPGNIQVRLDHIDMLVVAEGRALLRHHINAFASPMAA